MRLVISTRIAVLVLAIGAFPGVAVSQQWLVEFLHEGQREEVLAAIRSGEADDLDALQLDGSTALFWATHYSDHEVVRALLDAGATANLTNTYGTTPLTEAIRLDDVELTRMLLEAGADVESPNPDNQTALMLAAYNGNLEIAKMLVERGADVNAIETFRNQDALMLAAGGNHADIVELLMANGAGQDLDRRAAHDDWPRQMTSEPRAQYRHAGGLTPLLFATRSGCLRCAVAIVEAGADVDRPNPDGITPLINAIDNRNFDIAMYLLDQGARPGAWDMYGRTPLYMAIDMNSFRGGGGGGFGGRGGFGGPGGRGNENTEPPATALEIARRLIGMGVDVNHQMTRMRPNGPGRIRFADYMMRGGTSALLTATMSNDHEAMELLLANGAEVDLPNVFRITPLMAAAGMYGAGVSRHNDSIGIGDPQAIVTTMGLLLDAGANVNAIVTDSLTNTAMQDSYVPGNNNEGKSALHAAARHARPMIVEFLLEHGADPTIVDIHGNQPIDYIPEPDMRPEEEWDAGTPSHEWIAESRQLLRDAMLMTP